MGGTTAGSSARPPISGPNEAPLLLLLTAAAAAAAGLLPVWAAGGVAARLAGRPWPRLRPTQLVIAAGGLFAHRDTRGWPAPAPPAGPTLALSVVFTAALLTAAAGVVLYAYRRGGRPSGFAVRADLTPVLSRRAARVAAGTARPGLTRAERRRAAPGQLGVPLGRHRRSRLPLWAPFTDCHGVIAPTQSGKTLRVLTHQLRAAPGFALVTSTKPDLLLLTALERQRTGHRVWVLDTGAAGPRWPRRVRWSLIAGCADLAAAERRAAALIAAGPQANAGAAMSAHGFFTAHAEATLAGYLCAAAHAGADVATLLDWLADPADVTAQRALLAAGLPVQAGRLAAVQRLVPETRDGIYATIANAVGCLARPDVLQLVSPPPGDGFDVDAAIRGGHTVYVLGSAAAAGSTAPLVTAFVEEILERARTLALAAPAERLDPPALALLDEVANIAPVPSLPETISDSAGRGVVISYALQSLGQARARWGADRAAVLVDNSTSLLVLGGGKSHRDLTALAALGGHHYRRRLGYSTSSRDSTTSSSEDRTPVLDPADLRRLRPGDGLLIYRDLPPALVALPGIWQHRRDWAALCADRDKLRAGTASSTPAAGA